MDTRLLRYYESELRHLREMGNEFAREFPKVAGRLGLENYGCADPYVERLLEGFSFLAARVQMKIDAEFPRFTNHLLEMVYPQYLAPTPSMMVVKMEPDAGEPALAGGIVLPRGTALRSQVSKDNQTSCEFRTAHDVTLWPLQLSQANYFAYSGEIGSAMLPGQIGPAKAVLRLRLRSSSGAPLKKLSLDRLVLYLLGSEALPARILESLIANTVGMVAMEACQPSSWHEMIPPTQIKALGFAEEEALLPASRRIFSGYRLLHEYFAFPQRYLFVELGGLARAVQRCTEAEMDILVLLDRHDPALEQAISVSNFALHCTPAINLFPKRADRIHLSDRQHEYHVVPDRTRPLDYEVYQVLAVTGYGAGPSTAQAFYPFYSANDLNANNQDKAYFQTHRVRRELSERQRRQGHRSSYIGSEVFLALVDAHDGPFRSDLRQLGIQTLCTNRDLVLGIPLGTQKTDFMVESGAPLKSVRCIAGPSMPVPSHIDGATAWRLVSQLSLNYLSLVDSGQEDGAAALRDLLRLYSTIGDGVAHSQIEGVRSVSANPIVRRLPMQGPACFGRGLQITLTLDDPAFEGSGVFVLGAVLERFLARYASLNSFVETTIRTVRRGEVMRWPARVGLCEIL